MDKITITILEDGTIKTETDKVSMPNHSNAEAFLRRIAELAGGSVSRKLKVGHNLLNALHKHSADGHTHQ